MTGTLDYGQGHAAPFAQVLSEKLGVPFERIRLLQGDSDELLAGGGTGGSRSMMSSGTAIVQAADEGDRAGQADRRATCWKPPPATSNSGNGRFTIAGTDRAIGIMELAREDPRRTEAAGRACRTRSTSSTSATARSSAFPNGCHVAEVEIDPDTGVDRGRRNTPAVNDFGTIINPLLVEGQVHGGVVQGIGQALMETTVYDADGQFLTGSYMDYAMPRAERHARIRASQTIRCPATTNPLGVKGCGEAGCAGALTSVMNAIVDALSELRHHEHRHAGDAGARLAGDPGC